MSLHNINYMLDNTNFSVPPGLTINHCNKKSEKCTMIINEKMINDDNYNKLFNLANKTNIYKPKELTKKERKKLKKREKKTKKY